MKYMGHIFHIRHYGIYEIYGLYETFKLMNMKWLGLNVDCKVIICLVSSSPSWCELMIQCRYGNCEVSRFESVRPKIIEKWVLIVFRWDFSYLRKVKNYFPNKVLCSLSRWHFGTILRQFLGSWGRIGSEAGLQHFGFLRRISELTKFRLWTSWDGAKQSKKDF